MPDTLTSEPSVAASTPTDRLTQVGATSLGSSSKNANRELRRLEQSGSGGKIASTTSTVLGLEPFSVVFLNRPCKQFSLVIVS